MECLSSEMLNNWHKVTQVLHQQKSDLFQSHLSKTHALTRVQFCLWSKALSKKLLPDSTLYGSRLITMNTDRLY